MIAGEKRSRPLRRRNATRAVWLRGKERGREGGAGGDWFVSRPGFGISLVRPRGRGPSPDEATTPPARLRCRLRCGSWMALPAYYSYSYSAPGLTCAAAAANERWPGGGRWWSGRGRGRTGISARDAAIHPPLPKRWFGPVAVARSLGRACCARRSRRVASYWCGVVWRGVAACLCRGHL